MGKSGDLLRAQKKQNTIYHFTAQQLADRDARMWEEWKKSAMDRAYIEAKKLDQERVAEMERREKQIENEIREYHGKLMNEFRKGSDLDKLKSYMRYLFALPCRVLIERFGWKYPTTTGTKKTNLEKFADAMTGELNRINDDEDLGIIEYANQTELLYGLSFEWEWEQEEEGGNDGENNSEGSSKAAPHQP